MADKYLDQYGSELHKLGQRAFRLRYTTPVLIVAGRAAPAPPARRASEARTALDMADPLHALVGRVYPLMRSDGALFGPVIVGRARDLEVDVVIPDASISKRHCAFAADGRGATIRDLGSRNGTSVNGVGVVGATAVRLCGGEALTLGRVQLTFETASGFAELVSGLG